MKGGRKLGIIFEDYIDARVISHFPDEPNGVLWDCEPV